MAVVGDGYLSIRGADTTLYEDSESHRLVIKHSNVKECIPNGASRRKVNGVMCSAETGWHTIHQQRSTVLRAPKNPPEAYGLYSYKT